MTRHDPRLLQALLRQNLYRFVMKAFATVSPGEPFLPNWHLEAICHHLESDTYLSPLGASVYLLHEMEIMSAAGIAVFFQNYVHPEYRQLFPPFLPYASVLDLLFNEGPKSLEILRSGRREPLSPDRIPFHVTEGEVLR